MLNAKDTVSDQRIEEIKKMIWEIFDTYKDGSSIARPVSYTHLTLPTNREV